MNVENNEKGEWCGGKVREGRRGGKVIKLTDSIRSQCVVAEEFIVLKNKRDHFINKTNEKIRDSHMLFIYSNFKMSREKKKKKKKKKKNKNKNKKITAISQFQKC